MDIFGRSLISREIVQWAVCWVTLRCSFQNSMKWYELVFFSESSIIPSFQPLQEQVCFWYSSYATDWQAEFQLSKDRLQCWDWIPWQSEYEECEWLIAYVWRWLQPSDCYDHSQWRGDSLSSWSLGFLFLSDRSIEEAGISLPWCHQAHCTPKEGLRCTISGTIWISLFVEYGDTSYPQTWGTWLEYSAGE